VKKVGICTVHTGYNYGSVLQAFASKIVLKKIGYEPVILARSGSIIKGRDIRLGKLLKILFRLIIHPSLAIRTMKMYYKYTSKKISTNSILLFKDFIVQYIQPEFMSWIELLKCGKDTSYKAFICGSDQIWKADSLYIDPFYYLRFSPLEKRIAFAPSFGCDIVPPYNVNRIAKNIREIQYLSVREASGLEIVKNLTGQNSVQLIDPTLLLNKEEWDHFLGLKDETSNEFYILVYFLGKPSERAKQFVLDLSRHKSMNIICLPSDENFQTINAIYPDAGPREFIKYVKNASYICTDSFHGTAFAINYGINFWTFERQYGLDGNQSTRIHSLLKLLDLEKFYDPLFYDHSEELDFTDVWERLCIQRNISYKYLNSSIKA